MRCETLLVCAAAASLFGCGQKGPLYLPDGSAEVVTRSSSAGDQAPAPATAPSPADIPADVPPANPDPKNKATQPK